MREYGERRDSERLEGRVVMSVDGSGELINRMFTI